jgi:carbamoyltransferase
MEVLGLNGVYPRSHDSSACLISDGVIGPNVEEERFTRSKKAFDTQPHNAVTYCLTTAEVNVSELDAITYGWQGPELAARDILPPQHANNPDITAEVVQVQHHEAHAASAFYTSPFEEAAVLVVDGQGENESTTIWRANAEGMQKLATLPIDDSLGYTYGAISRFCGLGSFGAGKVMGLAPYGTPRYVDTIAGVYDSIRLGEQTTHDSQDAFFGQFTEGLAKLGFQEAAQHHEFDPLTKKVRKQPILEDVHRDMAASVQQFLEIKMLELAKEAQELTGLENLCLAGGVAMNCVTNSVVQNSGLFSEVFMQPGCEDSGIALGSALAYTKQKTPLTTPYSGPSFTNDQIAQVIQERGIHATRHDDIASVAARLVVGGELVGWFQGGLEYGPRALGNRSILANPTHAEMKDRVNAAKSREPWRPFGPSVLAEHADQLFEHPHESRYMLRSFQVRQEWQDRMAAAVHVDGSTRPQTVSTEDNPLYHELISNVHELTGTPAVLNTSFNSWDEPIVSTPGEAIRTFASTGLNSLVIGNYLIRKAR